MKRFLLIFAIIIIPFGGSLIANDSIPKKTFKEYAGHYTLPENQFAQSITIEVINDTLVVVSEIGSVPLTHLTDDRFEVLQYGVQVQFIKDELKQKVLGVRVTYTEGDIDITGKKEND